MPTINASATLAVSNATTVAEAQSNLTAAYLAVAAKLYGRTARDFYFVQTRLGQSADDPLAVLAFLLACEAGSTCNQHSTDAVIGHIVENATLLLDEIFAVRRMPLNRLGDDALAELKQQIATARSLAGLDALPNTALVPWWLSKSRLLRSRCSAAPKYIETKTYAMDQ